VENQREILDLFARQHGCAHVDQLRELGMSTSSTYRWRRRQVVIDIMAGVVRLAGSPMSFAAMAMAAQLQSRPEGYLSGFTAGALRGLSGMPRRRVYVTVPRRPTGHVPRCRQRQTLPSWIDRSESNWHDDRNVVLQGVFRLEEPYSMLFTIASAVNDHRFERIAEEAWKLRLITPPGLQRYVDDHRRRGRSGVTRTLHWLGRAEGRTRPMQSGLEVEFLQALRRAGLPEPTKQHPLKLRSGEVIHLDLAWPKVKLAIEPGHSWYHDGELLADRDRQRDRGCNELGWLVMRYSESARENLAACAAEIRNTYRLRVGA
jgi:very-short-patch-repair endonuclease